MIISHKFRFIYIQNRKVGGSSVQACLGRHCGPEDILTSNGRIPGQNAKGFWNIWKELRERGGPTRLRRLVSDLLYRKKFEPHMSGLTIKARVPSHVWDRYFKFCIERNPWDKTLSYFFMKQHHPQFSGVTFDQFLEWGGNLCSDYSNYTDPKGSLLVDQVLRYESLRDDLERVCAMLGIPFEGDIHFKINSEQRSDRRPYVEVYSPEQRSIIERIYNREIKMFGYAF